MRDQLELMPEDALLDFGCGIGAFRNYLPPWVGYCGVDWAEPLLERARADSSRGYFFDELPYWHWQHVVAIGTFNLPGSLEDTQRWIWLLWERAHKTLVVSLYKGDDPRCISYDPADLAFPGAQVVEGYLDNDFLLVGRR